MPDHRVGGEVDAFCTRCKMTLAHTILAMVGVRIARVRCNTCMGEHAYKSGPPSEPRPRAAGSAGSRSTSRGRATSASFDEQLAGKDTTHSRPYSISDKFSLDQVIDHPTFGRGFVATARADKIEVVFRTFVKTLVHARGGAPAPARPPPIPQPELEAVAAPVLPDVEGSSQA